MRSAILRALLAGALAAGLLGGCLGGGSPAPRFYTLSSASGAAAGPPLASRPELGLAVGPLELPRFLDRPELVTRDGSHRLVVADSHRWGGSLRSDVLRVVADDLGRLLGTVRVAVYPDAPRFRADYRVLLDLRELDAVPGQQVHLRVRWTVTSVADGKALAVEETAVEQPVASADFEDVVAAESAALGAVTRAIAARIAQLPGTGAGPPGGGGASASARFTSRTSVQLSSGS
jgi:uncharacterized lipoprotein YmbA